MKFHRIMNAGHFRPMLCIRGVVLLKWFLFQKKDQMKIKTCDDRNKVEEYLEYWTIKLFIFEDIENINSPGSR